MGQITKAACQKWVEILGIAPVLPLPRFQHAPEARAAPFPRNNTLVGPKGEIRADLGDPLVEVVIWRETGLSFFPPKLHVPLLVDILNNVTTTKIQKRLQAEWKYLLVSHVTVYQARHSTGLLRIEMQNAPRPEIHQIALHRVLKMTAIHAHKIAPDSFVSVVSYALLTYLSEYPPQNYTPLDVKIITHALRYVGRNLEILPPKSFHEVLPDYQEADIANTLPLLDNDPLSPTFILNTEAVGLTWATIYVEFDSSITIFTAHQLLYVPDYTLGISNLTGCTHPVLMEFFLAPEEVIKEYRHHLDLLRKNNAVLSFKIFRNKDCYQIVNVTETLGVKSGPPSLITYRDTKTRFPQNEKNAGGWQDSFFLRPLMAVFQARSFHMLSLTNFNPRTNYEHFRFLLQAAAIFFRDLTPSELVILTPLLKAYRDINYITRLIEFAADCFGVWEVTPANAIQSERQLQLPGRLLEEWESFPEKGWLIDIMAKKGAPDAKLTCVGLVRKLNCIAYLQIPEPFDCVKAINEELAIARKEIAGEIPEKNLFNFFTEWHRKILRSGLLRPRITLSVWPVGPWNDFVIFATKTRPFPQVCSILRRHAAQLSFGIIQKCRDESGAVVLVGIVRTSIDGFQKLSQKLAGNGSILGPNSRIFVARRSVYSDQRRRNPLNLWNPTTKQYAPIGEHLQKMRNTYLAGWKIPRPVTDVPYLPHILSNPWAYQPLPDRSAQPSMTMTPKLARTIKRAWEGEKSLTYILPKPIRPKIELDVNWPVYGLDRFLLHVILGTRQPLGILQSLITPATRRVLVSSTLLGAQAAFLEYLWPRNAPDDGFLRYIASRTEKNILGFSIQRIKNSTYFFNVDQVANLQATSLDAVDLQVLLQAPTASSRRETSQHQINYEGDIQYPPGCPEFRVALSAFDDLSSRGELNVTPPQCRVENVFNPVMLGFHESVSLMLKGEIDAQPLCKAFPIGQYFETEDAYTQKPAHYFFMSYPAFYTEPVLAFLDNFVRDTRVSSALTGGIIDLNLVEVNLQKIEGKKALPINPLRANPIDPNSGQFIHLPKRERVGEISRVLSFEDQYIRLKEMWEKAT